MVVLSPSLLLLRIDAPVTPAAHCMAQPHGCLRFGRERVGLLYPQVCSLQRNNCIVHSSATQRSAFSSEIIVSSTVLLLPEYCGSGQRAGSVCARKAECSCLKWTSPGRPAIVAAPCLVGGISHAVGFGRFIADPLRSSDS